MKKQLEKLTDSMTLNMSMITGKEAMEQGFKYFVYLIDGETPPTEEPKKIDPELLEQEFQILWMMYPRRLGKMKACRAYIQARKKEAFPIKKLKQG